MEKGKEGGGDSSSPLKLGEMENAQDNESSQLKPKLDRIFAEVEKNLPSVDFDISDADSDCDETAVFHRQLKVPLLEEEKDHDTSLNDIQFDIVDKTSNEMPMYDNDVAYILQQKNPTDSTNTSSISNWSKMTENTDRNNVYELEQRINTAGAGLDLKTTKNIDNSISRATSGTSLPTSQITLKTLSLDAKQKSLRTKERELVTNYLPPNAPILATSNFSNINIDALLDSLNEVPEGPPPPRLAWAEGENSESYIGSGEGHSRTKDSASDGGTLIEKLARMTMDQSGEDLTGIDPCTGALHKSKIKELKTVSCGTSAKMASETTKKNVEPSLPTPPPPHIPTNLKKTVSCGTNTSDFPFRTDHQQDEKEKTIEPDTVFIDVRNFEKHRKEEQQRIERVKEILGIESNCLSESSDSEDEIESWALQRRKMKEAILNKDTTPEMNSKIATKKARGSSYLQPTRVTCVPMPGQKIDVKRNVSADHLVSPIETPEALDREQKKQQKMEAARKAHEQKEKERVNRVRLRRHLEALRPTASVSGRQPSAENTPLLFDMEASYELSPSSLPRQMTGDHECLLLKVHLSSNGEIVLHRNKANKSVDSGMGLSASYTTLLTWLLSLVPSDFTFLSDSTKRGPSDIIQGPFHVIGLQQLWLEEQHSLVVAIIPASHLDTKSDIARKKKTKLKDNVKDASVFYQLVTKYLSTNSLNSVCPWLSDMVSIGIDGKKQKTGFVYTPPLPDITTKPLSTFIQVNPNTQAAQRLFKMDVGFFWQTIDSGESCCDNSASSVEYDTENTMSIVYKRIYQECHAMMGVFNRILQEGLDLAGIRLLYPVPEMVNTSLKKPSNFLPQGPAPSDLDILYSIGPVLAIAIRGTYSHSIWLETVGPLDPPLARRTDPNSLCALYGGTSRDECWLFCPRAEARVLTELARWFGGRVPSSGVFQVGIPYMQTDHDFLSGTKSKKSRQFSPENSIESVSVPEERPPAALTATSLSSVFLVLSSWIPPSAVGVILATCQRRGYQLSGVRRLCLNNKKASTIGITPDYWSAFCPGMREQIPVTPGQQPQGSEAMYPVMVLLLQRENAAHNVASLVEACMIQLAYQGVLGDIQRSIDAKLSPLHLFCTVPYSEGLLSVMGGNFSKCSEFQLQTSPGYIMPKLHSNPELEQVVVLLLFSHDIIKTCGLLIGGLLNLMPHSKIPTKPVLSEGLELLGLKWLPHLNFSQANEVTPYEAGDVQWKKSVHAMTKEPVLIVVLRGVNAFIRLQSIFPTHSSYTVDKKTGHLDKLMSSRPEDAYTYTKLFFTDKELYPDPLARPTLAFIPHCRIYEHWQERLTGKNEGTQFESEGCKGESIMEVMSSGPCYITTILVVKPATVAKNFSKILKKVDQEGFQIVGMRFSTITKDVANTLLARSNQEQQVEYMTSGPCLCLCLQRENAVKKLLDLIGPSDPKDARQQNQFLWRGVFGIDSEDDAFYASPNYLQSVEDIRLLFHGALCSPPTQQLSQEKITTPNIDLTVDLQWNKHRHIELKVERCGLEMGDNLECQRLLMQGTCIVLKPRLVTYQKGRSPYVDIVEALMKQGFEVVGARQVWLTREQSEHILHIINAGSYNQVPELTAGGSMVLALQRKNAVVAFDGLLGQLTASGSILDKFGMDILRPTNTEQAEQLLACFFDRFPARSFIQIRNTDSPVAVS